MKKALLLIVAIATLFTGCGKIESDINNLKDRIDQLEQKVSTIDEQIVAINKQIHLFNYCYFVIELLQNTSLDTVLCLLKSDVAEGDNARLVHQIKNAIARVLVATLVNDKNLLSVRGRFDTHHTEISLGNDRLGIDLPPNTAEQNRFC
jgi:hypothetical protein